MQLMIRSARGNSLGRVFLFILLGIVGLFSFALALSHSVQGQTRSEAATPLDPPYPPRPQVWDDIGINAGAFDKAIDDVGLDDKSMGQRSDTPYLISLQTPVKAQIARGICSIFSSTALIEYYLKNNYPLFQQGIDLSEEWLQYIISRDSSEEGSHAFKNYWAASRFGMVKEETWNYVGESWEGAHSPLAQERCQRFNKDSSVQKQFKSCLIGHRGPDLLHATNEQLQDSASESYDPGFVSIRDEAQTYQKNWIAPLFAGDATSLGYVSQIREALDQNVPVILELEFYYGAWNHRKATEIGLTRDMNQWNQGIINYPEQGSVDRKRSPEMPVGHSILLVGFDDDQLVTTEVLMQNGQKQTFTHRGVYYFKNSWGTDNFGRSFTLNGKSYPGYGMIPYDYAHEFGAFYTFR